VRYLLRPVLMLLVLPLAAVAADLGLSFSPIGGSLTSGSTQLSLCSQSIGNQGGGSISGLFLIRFGCERVAFAPSPAPTRTATPTGPTATPTGPTATPTGPTATPTGPTATPTGGSRAVPAMPGRSIFPLGVVCVLVLLAIARGSKGVARRNP
jgi:hypothetical protein